MTESSNAANGRGSGTEGADGLVQTGADPGDLGLGDPRVDAHRLDQVVDAASRDALDVGLHHHRVQGLVDAAAGLEDHREDDPLRSLGIRKPTSPAWVVTSRGRVPFRSTVRDSVRS
jgi:hypothetical protein